MPRNAGKRTARKTPPSSKAETERSLELSGGRSLHVGSSGAGQTLELRAASGQLELRILLTDQGPVLQVEAAKLEIAAAESIAMKCETLEIDAREKIAIGSAGGIEIKSADELEVESTADVRVRGKLIWLN